MRVGFIRLILYGVACVAIVILIEFMIELRSVADNERDSALLAASSSFTDRVENEVRTMIDRTQAVAALFESSTVVDEREYARFINRAGILSQLSQLRAIAAIPMLKRDEVPKFLAELKSRRKIRELLGYPETKIIIDPHRDIHAPVIYVESTESRTGIVGFDIASSPERWRAAQASLTSSQAHMTSPIRLSQDTGRNLLSVLFIVGVKSGGNMGLRDYKDANADRTLFIASSYSPDIGIDILMRKFTGPFQFSARITDVTDTEQTVIFSSPDVPSELDASIINHLVLGNRVWALEFFPNNADTVSFFNDRYMILGVMGVLMILALTFTLDRVVKIRSVLEDDVQEQTEQLRSLNAVLVETARKASAESEAKSAFLAQMSHELRTPLNAVIGYAQMLASEMFGKLGNPHYHEYAKTIEEAGKIQLQLVEDILSLTALQGGQRELDIAPLDLEAIAQQSMDFVRKRAEESGIILKFVSLLGDYEFLGDSRSIQQILLNLLSNAVKFTPAGGTITVRMARDQNGTLSMAVEDNGIGIALENIDKVMQPFGQATNSPYNAREGVGLGLSIVTGLAEANGGTVRLESEPGKGTIVTVVFPMRPDPDADTQSL